jgi:TolB-like protein/Tfp pilus assembly protein PilF
MRFKKYIEELKRRNVFKAAIAYVIMAWVVIQVASIVLGGFDAPTYIFKLIVFVICIAFPFWLVFAWVYDITPEGIKKTDDIAKKRHTPPRTQYRLNKVIIVSLLIVVAFLLFNQSGYFTNKKKEAEKNEKILKNKEKSIVVLPFLNLSRDNNEDYLGEGITDAINVALSKKDSVRVISRTSAMTYKDDNKLLSDIAKELEVDYLLEGSVLSDADSVRIMVQLIKSFPREKHIWSRSYKEKFENILQLVDRVSNEIADEITAVVKPNQLKADNHKVNAKAYELYLRGRYLMNLETYKAVNSAIEYLNESIKMDPNYAPAYATLAESYISLNKFYSIHDEKEKHTKNARAAIEKALLLDNSLGSAYIIKGKIAGKCDWNWEEMRKMAEIGLKLDPKNSNGHMLLSNYYLVTNEFNKAIAEALFAEKLDPLNPMIGSLVAERYYLAHDYEKAIAQYKKVLELFPNYGFAWEGMGYVQYFLGQKEEAINSWKRLQEIMGNDSTAINFTFAGNAEQSFRLWLSKAKRKSLSYTSNPTVLAQVHMFLNEKKEALDWLEKAYEIHEDELPMMLQRPNFHELHKEHRFKELVRKTGINLNK